MTTATPKTRLYLVESKTGGPAELVLAASGASALRHVARFAFAVRPAKPKDVAEVMGAGRTIQVAGDEPSFPVLLGLIESDILPESLDTTGELFADLATECGYEPGYPNGELQPAPK